MASILQHSPRANSDILRENEQEIQKQKEIQRNTEIQKQKEIQRNTEIQKQKEDTTQGDPIPTTQEVIPIEGIQSDFEIVLKLPRKTLVETTGETTEETDCYPFLKKFSTLNEFSTKDFFEKMSRVFKHESLPYTFCIDFRNNIISWIHYKFIPENLHKDLLSRENSIFLDRVKQIKEGYNVISEEFLNLLKSYILFQLQNCGNFDELRRISENSNNKLYFRINIHNESIKSTNFHNDSTIFQMLQYFNFDSEFVLSSELMLYDTPETRIHRRYNKSNQSFPNYGQKTNDAFNMINEVFKRLEDNHLQPGLLRGIYSNGDTLSWSDCLIKHAVINTEENFITDTQIKTNVATNRQQDIYVMVNVCPLRIKTDESHYKGRKLIGLSIFNDKHIEKGKNYIYELYSFDISFQDITKLDIPVAEFNEDNCFKFFEAISKGEECIQINTQVSIKTRGGKNKKIQKQKRSIRKQTIRKRSIRKQTIQKQTIQKYTKIKKTKNKLYKTLNRFREFYKN